MYHKLNKFSYHKKNKQTNWSLKHSQKALICLLFSIRKFCASVHSMEKNIDYVNLFPINSQIYEMKAIENKE